MRPRRPDVAAGCSHHDHRDDVALVKVQDARPDGYDGTCLRPLGLCELGGCCEVCWYRPDHPRFRQRADEARRGFPRGE